MTLSKNIFAVLAILSVILLILAALVLAVGLAVGLVINWIFPSFGLGISAILALVTLMAMSQMLTTLAQFVANAHKLPDGAHRGQSDEEYEAEEFEPDVLSEDQVEYMVDQVSEAVVARLLAVGHVEQSTSRSKHRSRR